ncbi:MAG: ArsR family transcriptional regulator [Rhodospirillaceae bacterium]|nr:ArsR family transcriptional regulator [Rhodospirillaceae bacterium]|tara:strand:- start:5580 stop:6566 length:987 start_codon:yes stop_codon:yes gene_type:complete
MEKVLGCLRAAAEPTRLRLLSLCAASDMNVSDLTSILGQSQPRVSRHLKLLCDAGLLDRYREGSWIFYRLADDTGEEGRIARQLIGLLPDDDQQISHDRERLEEIRSRRANAAEAYFRANAEEWDSLRSLHVEESDVEFALSKCFPDHFEDFLDIGTGTGRMLQLFADRVDRGIGIDMSRDMLSVARANLERMEIRHCHVRLGDMYRLSMEDDSFDGVIVHQVLHYSEDPARVISEAARVLRPDGTLVVADFSPHKLEALRDEHAHLRLGFEDSEIFDLFDKVGLVAGSARKLEGSPLTVTIWSAKQPGIFNQEFVAPLESARFDHVK